MDLLKIFLLISSTLLIGNGPDRVPFSGQENPGTILLEDFENYQAEGLPTGWRYIDGRQKLLPVTNSIMTEDEYFIVRRENGNKYLRAVTIARAHRLLIMNKDQYDWNLTTHPRLQWRWRAIRLPAGAREDVDEKNDTGAAVYVTFSRDWLGRPRSIKYSYSTTLPVGSVISYGRLKVVVVSSGLDGTGKWETVTRNVAQDYQDLFGKESPEEPVSIMLWSDSNSVEDIAEVDFDDINLLSASIN